MKKDEVTSDPQKGLDIVKALQAHLKQKHGRNKAGHRIRTERGLWPRQNGKTCGSAS